MSAPTVPVVEPEDGANLLNEIHATLIRYVAFTSPEHVDAVTLYIAATHAQPVWEHATRMVIKSPLKRCGKTRLQEIISGLVHQALRTVNISSAALVRSIDLHDPPTLLLDEGDSVFATRRGEHSEKAEDLRGILNSGHSRGWPYVRWNAATRQRENCPTFAMAVVGGIGDFPDTIEDRAVIVPMRRRAPGEEIQQYRSRRVVPVLHDLRDRLHDWVRGYLDQLDHSEPDMPVEDRAADTWESLIAIADLAGGDWPDRARKACMVMTGAVEPDEATASERLLADLRDIFDNGPTTLLDEPVQHLSTGVILQRLVAIDEAPWGDWYGKALDARHLARLLKPYGVRSRNIREGASVVKGYAREDLLDAFARYVRYSATEDESAHVNHVAHDVAPEATSGATPSELQEYDDVAPVAPVAHGRGDSACKRCGKPNQHAPRLCDDCLADLRQLAQDDFAGTDPA